MKVKVFVVMLGFASFLAISGPALAHHNAASLFSPDVETTVTGTVKQFGFINPHCLLVMDIKNKAGVPEEWRMEFGTPSMLNKVNLNKDSVKPGMQITVVMNPYFGGKKNGFVTEVTLPDGKHYNVHPKTNATGGNFPGTPDFKVEDDAPAKKK
jgi:hypothetical protein